MLPDDVLLEILDFCADEEVEQFTKKQVEAWVPLVHVCRLWRGIVFRSPRRLNLRLVCTPGTPARDTVDVWPALPLLIRAEGSDALDMNNIISVFGRNVRVSQIKLVGVPGLQLEKVSAAMQEPFPELIHLELWSNDKTRVLPDSFVGGFPPSLRFLLLSRIIFPGLPILLLSATHLVDLHLLGIPNYSSETILATLMTLTNLESLSLKFQYPHSPHFLRPYAGTPFSPFFLLPVLTRFWFKGEHEYLDGLVTSIDSPQLEYLDIIFFNNLEFNTPQLLRFITRAPMLNAPEKAHISFGNCAARVNLLSQSSGPSGYGEVIVEISCRVLDYQVSSVDQVCASLLRLLSTGSLKDLYIFEHPHSQPDWQCYMEGGQWLELLHPFTDVKNLYLSEVYAPYIVLSLQELVVERETETMWVLPALQNIFLKGLQPSGAIMKAIEEFVDTRENFGHPIVVSRWDGRSKY